MPVCRPKQTEVPLYTKYLGLGLLCLALGDISTHRTEAREILLTVNIWENNPLKYKAPKYINSD